MHRGAYKHKRSQDRALKRMSRRIQLLQSKLAKAEEERDQWRTAYSRAGA